MADAFPYLSILTSIIIGLGITRIFTGLGRLLERRSSIHLYWVHILWSFNVLLFMVLQWWILFRWQNEQNWNFFLFSFLLISPTITFLLSVILFHEPLPLSMDFKEHYFENHRAFFLLAAALPPLDAIDTLLKGYAHFVAQGTIYPVTLSLVFVLSIVAARTKNETYHKAFSVFFLVYILAFITINLNTLM